MNRGRKRPIRILHVVYAMNRGGVETWLMSVLRNIDRDEFRMDFLVHTAQPCAYDDEIGALGSKVIPCLHKSGAFAHGRNFRRALREHGPYDVVHSHASHWSGHMLRLAHQSGVPIRVAHSHNTVFVDNRASGVHALVRARRRAELALLKWWIRRHATVGLAASREAASALFGSTWEADARWRVMWPGVDLAPFGAALDSAHVRGELGIPADAFAIGHVGRFDRQKNHAFLLQVFREVASRDPQAWLLLVGDGPLRRSIEEQVQRSDVSERVVFAGVRGDVPRVMRGAMDVLVLPSLYEGLPLVGIEAQAAGLPVVLSDAITSEVAVVEPLVRRVSLSEPACVWAEVITGVGEAGPTLSQWEAIEMVRASPFHIQACLEQLAEVYRGRG